jgi:hypothetical protein
MIIQVNYQQHAYSRSTVGRRYMPNTFRSKYRGEHDTMSACHNCGTAYANTCPVCRDERDSLLRPANTY